MNLPPLLSAIADFEKAGRAFNESAKLTLANSSADPATEDRVNRELMQVERNWCNPEGIPGRPWFKHSLYAARYTYAHLELPGITEAAEAKDWKRAESQKAILIAELKKNTTLLQQAASDLESARPH
jgi:N-acetylated-alpha-linked acidic dipeptidase